MCIVNRRQQFIATVDNKELAAVVHDVIQIQNNGITMKTNFSYTILDLVALLTAQSLMDVRRLNQPANSDLIQ